MMETLFHYLIEVLINLVPVTLVNVTYCFVVQVQDNCKLDFWYQALF